MTVESLEQLDSLNNLMAMAVGTDRDLVRQIKHAIEFTQENSGENISVMDSLTRCAERLLNLHLQGRARCGFQHCDFRDQHNDPLWIRSRFLEAMRGLSGCRDAVMLISGLKDLVCPPRNYWTKARQRDYIQVQQLIEQLAASYAPRRMNLRMIFL
ncbi:hypothetical protein [Rubellicoccus peritrichatus]|uniref:Uncharacterized protein n=1 Tax=Rubellicoccus peritrichatus TaxID=3080537 RepID=A0AAQ3LA84_9BACT|nr:hypothetical protein [Puniceicoccus sp. CR14]WOO41961.1 hypothetical protein RZN69_02595 [Puniceicoccus sp. CR14]